MILLYVHIDTWPVLCQLYITGLFLKKGQISHLDTMICKVIVKRKDILLLVYAY